MIKDRIYNSVKEKGIIGSIVYKMHDVTNKVNKIIIGDVTNLDESSTDNLIKNGGGKNV